MQDMELISQPRPRVKWIDATRGIAVVAVVLMHYLSWLVDPSGLNEGRALAGWSEFVAAMAPLRMPLLFLISGIVAASALRAPTRRPGLRRVYSSLYLVLVWTVLYNIVGYLIPGDLPGPATSLREFVLQMLFPSTILWFIYTLGASALLIVLLRRAPAWTVLTLFFAIGVAARVFQDDLDNLAWRAMVCAFFFALGVYGKETLLELVARPWPWPRAVVYWLAFLGAGVTSAWTAFSPLTEHVNWVVSAAVLSLAVMLVIAQLCRIQWIARALGGLGQKTLPIFILHLPIAWTIVAIPALHEFFFLPLLRPIWPLMGTIYLVASSLLAYWLMMKTPLRVLFALPPRWFPITAEEKPTGPTRAPATRAEARAQERSRKH
ncbi:acyltransferase [Mycetocola lacteus]|uniref:Acyltransferase n=2 Tax=Mycetocola lacteus TaxID=76637 RepID=A0A3L7AT46_9MICO|nr:acyltransferase [Mycetocola lacteus]